MNVSAKRIIILFAVLFAYKLTCFFCEPYLTVSSSTVEKIILICITESVVMTVIMRVCWILYRKLSSSKRTKANIVAVILFVGSVVYSCITTGYYSAISLQRLFLITAKAVECTIIIGTAILSITGIVRWFRSK